MKRILWMAVCLAALATFYYLVIHPYEFRVNMPVKTLPGDVIETIRIWNRSLPGAVVTEVDSFRSLNQKIVWNGREYLFDWHFTLINDSLTKIKVDISQPGRAFLNKIMIPFSEQPIERDAGEALRQFYSVMSSHLSLTNVKILGEASLDSTFCVCASMATRQIEKGNGMMKDYARLTSFVDHFKLDPDGPPLVKVREWDHSEGHLKFDFCFPIAPTDSLPRTNALAYHQFGKLRVLKAEYHGNYFTSDRAWYALMHYASQHGYKVTGLPIEYFYNNPNLGLNEARLRAEVFLPIAE